MPARNAKTPPTRRGFHFADFKALDEQHGTFEGYLAVFGNEDAGGDIIEPGAFTKSLAELKSRQQGRKSRYLLPVFWGHDPNEPIGGFTDASEDPHGLYVKGQLDLDIEQGRRAYSGMVKGYCDGMSIGYFTTKYDYDRMSRRHLRELALFEGSVTPIPMNSEATITEVKSACGDTGLPFADRERAWDNAAAHKRIVAWATDSDGNLDAAKMKQAHFWYDESAPDNVTSYKLGFADLIDDKLTAIPRGIFAVAAVLSGSRGGADLDGDTDAVKAKVATMYKRMAKEFDDDSIVAPWDADAQKGYRMPTDRQYRKARNFDTLFQSLNAADDLQDEWGDTFIAFTRAMWELMAEAQAQANGWFPSDMPTIDPVEAAQANLDAFSTAVVDLVRRSAAAAFSPCLDNDGDQFLDPDGVNADEDNDDAYYMSRDTIAAEGKAGRMMSAANHSELGGMISDMGKSLKAMTASHKALQAFHAKVDPSATTKPDGNSQDDGADTTSGDAGDTNGNKKSMQPPPTDTGAGRESHDTTPQGEPVTATDVQAAIRARMQAYRLAQRVETAQASA